MKKLILLLILFGFMVVNCYSQVQKGTIMLNAYSSARLSSSTDSYFEINPGTSIFLTDHFCLGISLPLLIHDNKLCYGIFPHGKFYLGEKEAGRFILSTYVALTSFINSENTFDADPISLGAGYVWFLNKSIGFETQMIVGTNLEDINIGAYFGFEIYFTRQNK